ncbi:3709_t:CDS:1, partial [Ambispora leptoticha]
LRGKPSELNWKAEVTKTPYNRNRTRQFYLDFPPEGVSYEFWARDLALIALGLRTMRQPGELCNLRLSDVKLVGGLFWVRINKSKTDQLAKEKFIPIEKMSSRFCSVERVVNYLKVRPVTKGDAPLFLSKSRKKMSVLAISAVVKRFAEHAKMKGRFTAHSLRIGGATAAMKGGLSMEQIQTIGGWVSDAARLYMRAIGTVNLGASIAMGFEG